MKFILVAGLLAALAIGEAVAQTPPRPLPMPMPMPTTTASVTGCLERQLWDVQGIDNYTLQIWLSVGGRSERFNFQPNRVEMISPAGTPQTTREQAERYNMIVRSLEAAGMARRPITLSYETASRKVFGIAVEWSMPQCA